MTDTALTATSLRKDCNPEAFAFETTKTLEPLDGLIGQSRAIDAIRLAATIRHRRFNLFVYGPEGSGRHSTVMQILNDEAKTRPTAADWVYVQNFDQPDHPKAVSLPVGTAPRLRAAMATMVDDLANHIPALFVSEDYQNRRMAINQEFSDRNEAAFETLRAAAKARDVGILRTPMGFSLAPMHEGEVLKADAMERLDKKARAEIEKRVKATQEELEDFLVALPEFEREHQAAVGKLNAQMAEVAVDAALSTAIAAFKDIEKLTAHFAALRIDLIANADLFLMAGKSDGDSAFPAAKMKVRDDPRFHRYAVNVMVSQPDATIQGAPVVVETMPTLANLTGRIDYMSTQGALVTDLTLVKPGALHRANGGFLVLDARRVLLEPFAWDALKRCLETSAVHIITAADRIGLISTTTLEPEPIPLDVRVVLVGDRLLHSLMSEVDPDFDQFFHVAAEFGDDTDRSPDALALFARLVATICDREKLRPVTRDGVAALINAATRAAEDQEKLSLRMSAIWDILREADHIAAQIPADLITAAQIEAATLAAETRGNRPRDQIQEMIARGTILISTKGSTVGQINGLTVADLGTTRFGFPARITARVRMGAGHVVDIEREVKLGGPIHSKAVLILSSFLVTRYAPDTPLSLWASLVIEQSYGGIEGDSASVAELCALMSALAEVPLSQSFAVTGSINQMGEVQPVGGINEKIEGFFDTCRHQGLTGRQGVLIPRRNVANLMLRRDVVEAVAAGQFQVHAISHVDEAMELLTGLAAGQRGMNGEFPDGSINGNIEVKLLTYAEMKRDFNEPPEPPPENHEA